MRRHFIAAIALASIATAGVGMALAQTPPPPPAQTDGAAPMPPRPGMGMGMGMRPGMGPGMWRRGGPGMHGPMRWQRAFGLLYTPSDRQLTTADVQTIAQAFLLLHGNHSWKVVDVKQDDPNAISFGYATPSGDVIARFTMDPHSGRIQRVG
jgi:hypothetical protein